MLCYKMYAFEGLTSFLEFWSFYLQNILCSTSASLPLYVVELKAA